MYFNEEAIDKFNQYLMEYKRKLEKQVKELDVSISYGNTLNSIMKRPSVERLLHERNRLISLDGDLEEKLDMLEFFQRNNALKLEQVSMIIKDITGSSIFTDYEKVEEDAKSKKETVLKESLNITSYIEDEEYDFLSITTLLEQSNLKEEEKLTILAKAAFDSCKEKVKEEIEVLEDAPLVDERYNTTREKVNALLEEYASFLKSKSEKEKDIARELAKCAREARKEMGEEAFSTSSFQYLEETLLTNLLEIMDIDEDLEQEKDEDIRDLYMEELNQRIHEVEELKEKLSQDVVEKTTSQPSKILYLLDSSGNVFFNPDTFDGGEKRSVSTILEKIEKGLLTVGRENTKAKMYTKMPVDYAVYIQREHPMACTYTRLTGDMVLILDIAQEKNIYRNTNRILSKNDSEILEIRKRKEDEIQEMLVDQKNIRTSLSQALKERGMQL